LKSTPFAQFSLQMLSVHPSFIREMTSDGRVIDSDGARDRISENLFRFDEVQHFVHSCGLISSTKGEEQGRIVHDSSGELWM
jgi:hypothetical protein